MIPSQFLQLERQERAFIVAAIETKIDEDKKQEKKLQKSTKKGR